MTLRIYNGKRQTVKIKSKRPEHPGPGTTRNKFNFYRFSVYKQWRWVKHVHDERR